MWKAFALNLNCCYIFVTIVMWMVNHPQALVPFSVNVDMFILYTKFTGSDSRLHLRGWRSLVLLICGPLFDFQRGRITKYLMVGGIMNPLIPFFFPSQNQVYYVL